MIDLTTVKVIIAGGREFDDYDYMRRCLDGLKAIYFDHIIEVVSGAARGADKLGERWAEEQGFTIHSRPADWKRYKNRAGPIRNEEMADESHVLCSFWDGDSRGTRHMIGAALRKGLEVHVFRYEKDGSKKGTTRLVGK